MEHFIENDYIDYDIYDEMNGFEHFDAPDDIYHFDSLYDTISCSTSSLVAAFNQLLTAIILVNISLKLLLLCINKFMPNVPKPFYQFLIIIHGLILLLYHFKEEIYLSIIFLSLSIIGLIIIKKTSKKFNLWVFAILIIIVNELIVIFWNIKFIKLRVFHMCMIMKLISLRKILHKISREEENEKKPRATFFSVISYFLDPQCIPFCSYHPPYLDQSLIQLSSTFLLESIISLAYSLLFFLFSNCFLKILYLKFEMDLIPQMEKIFPLSVCHIIDKFVSIYITALEFRTSHYFVCYLTESLRRFWNQNVSIAKPRMIELPRSLVDVVVAWDIPTHLWLKQYVFLPSKNKYGPVSAIFITYLISSFMHGLRFEIWSVLLSLGLLTWIEFRLRDKLSIAFNACIKAKRCYYVCRANIVTPFSSMSFWDMIKAELMINDHGIKCSKGHKFTPFNSVFVKMTNFFFTILAITHLAYLGCSFGPDEKFNGISHVLNVWGSVGYFSHLLGIFTIIFYLIIG